MSEKEPLDFERWSQEKRRKEIDEIGRKIDRLYKAGMPQEEAMKRFAAYPHIVQFIYAIGGLPNNDKPPGAA